MARAKKEVKEQELNSGNEFMDQTAGTDAASTNPELDGEPGTPAPLDLELADAVQLSQTDLPPDANLTSPGESSGAPQTDLETAGDGVPEPGGVLQPPQTDLEPGADPPGAGEVPIASQTDLEAAGDGASEPGRSMQRPQTGLESAEATEGQADKTAVSQTDSEPLVGEAAGESGAAAPQTDTEQPKNRLRMPGRRGQRVVSIDAERTVETDADKLRSDLLDLVESLKGKKILTGTIQGVERLADNPEMSYAVTYHGDYKVIIPVLEAVEEPEDYRGQPKGDVLHYLLNKRLGAEVDYIIKGIDQESGVVAASRLEAMAMKRKEYYFRTDRDGNYQIYAGICAEARVVSVIRAGIFVDLFGAECYIPLRELSYQRWVDATAHYQSGQRVLVRVLEVDRDHRSQLRVSASVKQAGENPYEKALKKYAVGSLYVGTVSMVDTTGVFVSLDGGIDCLCTYPKRGRPPRGCRVSVRILGINYESNRIWGVITHMSTVR